MSLQGTSIIGLNRAEPSGVTSYGIQAATGERLEPAFHAATTQDLDRAAALASSAFPTYRALPRASRAAFLRAIADRIERGQAAERSLGEHLSGPEGLTAKSNTFDERAVLQQFAASAAQGALVSEVADTQPSAFGKHFVSTRERKPLLVSSALGLIE